MIDLKEMTADSFAGLENKDFIITSTDPEIQLELVEVKKMGSGERMGGAFSLLWQGPLEPQLPQATYSVSHTGIGQHDMFLVPVAEKEAGIQYEAIFT